MSNGVISDKSSICACDVFAQNRYEMNLCLMLKEQRNKHTPELKFICTILDVLD